MKYKGDNFLSFLGTYWDFLLEENRLFIKDIINSGLGRAADLYLTSIENSFKYSLKDFPQFKKETWVPIFFYTSDIKHIKGKVEELDKWEVDANNVAYVKYIVDRILYPNVQLEYNRDFEIFNDKIIFKVNPFEIFNTKSDAGGNRYFFLWGFRGETFSDDLKNFWGKMVSINDFSYDIDTHNLIYAAAYLSVTGPTKKALKAIFTAAIGFPVVKNEEEEVTDIVLVNSTVKTIDGVDFNYNDYIVITDKEVYNLNNVRENWFTVKKGDKLSWGDVFVDIVRIYDHEYPLRSTAVGYYSEVEPAHKVILNSTTTNDERLLREASSELLPDTEIGGQGDLGRLGLLSKTGADYSGRISPTPHDIDDVTAFLDFFGSNITIITIPDEYASSIKNVSNVVEQCKPTWGYILLVLANNAEEEYSYEDLVKIFLSIDNTEKIAESDARAWNEAGETKIGHRTTISYIDKGFRCICGDPVFYPWGFGPSIPLAINVSEKQQMDLRPNGGDDALAQKRYNIRSDKKLCFNLSYPSSAIPSGNYNVFQSAAYVPNVSSSISNRIFAVISKAVTSPVKIANRILPIDASTLNRIESDAIDFEISSTYDAKMCDIGYGKIKCIYKNNKARAIVAIPWVEERGGTNYGYIYLGYFNLADKTIINNLPTLIGFDSEAAEEEYVYMDMDINSAGTGIVVVSASSPGLTWAIPFYIDSDDRILALSAIDISNFYGVVSACKISDKRFIIAVTNGNILKFSIIDIENGAATVVYSGNLNVYVNVPFKSLITDVYSDNNYMFTIKLFKKSMIIFNVIMKQDMSGIDKVRFYTESGKRGGDNEDIKIFKLQHPDINAGFGYWIDEYGVNSDCFIEFYDKSFNRSHFEVIKNTQLDGNVEIISDGQNIYILGFKMTLFYVIKLYPDQEAKTFYIEIPSIDRSKIYNIRALAIRSKVDAIYPLTSISGEPEGTVNNVTNNAITDTTKAIRAERTSSDSPKIYYNTRNTGGQVYLSDFFNHVLNVLFSVGSHYNNGHIIWAYMPTNTTLKIVLMDSNGNIINKDISITVPFSTSRIPRIFGDENYTYVMVNSTIQNPISYFLVKIDKNGNIQKSNTYSILFRSDSVVYPQQAVVVDDKIIYIPSQQGGSRQIKMDIIRTSDLSFVETKNISTGTYDTDSSSIFRVVYSKRRGKMGVVGYTGSASNMIFFEVDKNTYNSSGFTTINDVPYYYWNMYWLTISPMDWTDDYMMAYTSNIGSSKKAYVILSLLRNPSGKAEILSNIVRPLILDSVSSHWDNLISLTVWAVNDSYPIGLTGKVYDSLSPPDLCAYFSENDNNKPIWISHTPSNIVHINPIVVNTKLGLRTVYIQRGSSMDDLVYPVEVTGVF